jgi:hypothetical protein
MKPAGGVMKKAALFLLTVLLHVSPSTQADETSGSSSGTGSGWRLIKLEELSVNYKKFHPSARHPLFYDSTPKEALFLTQKTTVAKYFFFDSTVQSMTNNAQYYMVGLNLKLGVRLSSYLDFQYEHLSQHILDDRYPHKKFPVEDSWGINLYLYRADNKLPSILP